MTSRAVLALAAGLFLCGPVGSVPPADVAEIARELNCPVCQGYNLQDCPLPVCAQMRDLIRERLEAGETKDEILAAFVDDYGPQVLNAPPREGVFLAAWLVPAIALAVGAAGALIWLRRGSSAAWDTSETGEPVALPEYSVELERLADYPDLEPVDVEER